MQTKTIVQETSGIATVAKAIGIPVGDFGGWMPVSKVGKVWEIARDARGHESLRCPWAKVEQRLLEQPDPACRFVPTLKTGTRKFCETHKHLANKCKPVTTRQVRVTGECRHEFGPMMQESLRDFKARLEAHLAHHRDLRGPITPPA